MKDTEKFLVAAVVGIGSIFLLTRVGRAVEGKSSTVSLQILDAYGNPVPKNSPVTLVEGSSYIARVTVTNKSVKLGQPAAAILYLHMLGAVGNGGTWEITLPADWSANFLAAEIKGWDVSFYCPIAAGATGFILVDVLPDPGKSPLATARESLSIIASPLIKGATVTLGIV